MNRDGDFIVINTDSGSKEAELISRFSLEGLGEYVIYRLDGLMYGAKYEIVDGNTKLITDLTDFEKESLNEVFSHLEVK